MKQFEKIAQIVSAWKAGGVDGEWRAVKGLWGVVAARLEDAEPRADRLSALVPRALLRVEHPRGVGPALNEIDQQADEGRPRRHRREHHDVPKLDREVEEVKVKAGQ